MELPSFLQPKRWYAGAFFAVRGQGLIAHEMNSEPYWGTAPVAMDQISKLVPQHGVLALGESTHRHLLALYVWDKEKRVWSLHSQKEL